MSKTQILSKVLKKKKRLVFAALGAFFLLRNVEAITWFFWSWKGDGDFSQLEYFDDINVKLFNISAWINETDLPRVTKASRPLCPGYPRNLVGNVSKSEYFLRDRPWQEILSENRELLPDGHFSPKNCRARHKVAVIIPLRERESQLRILLSHMLPVWKRQQIEFGVYTITQAGGQLFNRAKLINVGVAEARKDRNYDCYVFHDVDLLLEDDRCLYWCYHKNPRHLAVHMNKFAYEPLTYPILCNPFSNSFEFPYFGGVSMLSHKQFLDANGFSNLFWGWGGEDDDIFMRLLNKGYSLANPFGRKCSFKMISHEHESSNSENLGRYSMMPYSLSRMEKDGFRSLKYRLISKENKRVYMNITVDIGKPTSKMVDFMARKLPWKLKCFARMPWH